MTENEVEAFALEKLAEFGLAEQGWAVEIVDECGQYGDAYGFCDERTSLIQLNRTFWPTYDHNIEELIRHEFAHALLGYGDHDERWALKLEELGGCGVWYHYDTDTCSHTA